MRFSTCILRPAFLLPLKSKNMKLFFIILFTVFFCQISFSQDFTIRGFIYRPFLFKCGKNFQVGIGAKLEHLKNIEVGDNVYIGHGCWISGVRGGIKFHNEVMLGPYVKMVSSNHTIINNSFRFGPGIGKPIEIGKGTWIASNAVITAGVTIGECCLVSAGSVVTKSFDSFSVLGGVPAKIIASCDEKYIIKSR